MCGRVVQAMSWSEIHHLLNIHSEPPTQAEPRYNVAPTTQVQMVLPLNARAETVSSSRFFRAIWPHRMLCPHLGLVRVGG